MVVLPESMNDQPTTNPLLLIPWAPRLGPSARTAEERHRPGGSDCRGTHVGRSASAGEAYNLVSFVTAVALEFAAAGRAPTSMSVIEVGVIPRAVRVRRDKSMGRGRFPAGCLRTPEFPTAMPSFVSAVTLLFALVIHFEPDVIRS